MVRRRIILPLALISLAVLSAQPSAQAKINPGFTPIDLVEQSATVLKITLSPTANPLLFDIKIVQAYKQEKGLKANLKLDLSSAPTKEQAEAVAKNIKARGGDFCLLFAGEFRAQAEGGGQASGGPRLAEGYLHLGQGGWISLFKAKDGDGYEMDKTDSEMEATWAGSTDMLDRCVKYILARKTEAVIPVASEGQWERNAKIGAVPGKVSCAVTVDLNAGPEYSAQGLFIGSDAGDKLFAYDAKAGEMADVTAQHKLASKSLLAVWGDFDRTGRPGLASWDGQALTLHLQQADGTFLAKPAATGDALKAGLVSLAVVDCGKDTPGLLAGTKAAPVLLTPAGDGKFVGTVLAGPAAATQPDKSPTSGQCLVADFDNRGLPDVIQLFETRGVIYKGKALGQFEPGQPTDVCLGGGRGKAWVGDYDGDGKLDIFCVSEDPYSKLWQNQGGLKFIDMFGMSGEISYIAKSGGIDGGTYDFTNSGRQGVLIVYGSGQSPQLFFNRGWRSTGHAHAPIDVDETGALPEARDGQQAGTMGDFIGNGGQDMAIVLTNGDVYVFYRKVFDGEPPLGVRAVLAGKAGPIGPITVVGYQDKECLGAWSVTAGSTAGFFGVRTAGARHFEWKTPDGKIHQADVKVLDQPVKFVVGK